jgi:VanZ family protein
MNDPIASQHTGKQGASVWQRFSRYGPVLLWMVFIWFASTRAFSAINTSKVIRPLILFLSPNLSEDRVAAIHFLIRKVAHFTEYAILAWLARRAFITSSHVLIRRYWFQLALLLIGCYSLLDEFHQSFVSSRTASLYDCAIDVAGGFTVLLVLKFYHRRGERV